MQTVDIVVESPCSETMRARQVCSMFDAPPEKKARREWRLELDLPDEWNVGLVVGPSGSGKSTALRELWGEPEPFKWEAAGVIDDVAASLSVADVTGAFQSVGFNTIPAWLRPFGVLSNGEKFRVELARALLERPDPIVIDEFTSVVDRQVAKIGSHAVQKFVRARKRQFVAVTCHYDVEDWLQPDWVLDMATCEFRRRLLRRRPSLECTVGPIPRAAWRMFAPFHYMTAELHKAAQCYGLWCEGKLACFAALLHNPISAPGEHVPIWRVSRVVTLPDFQGLGLAFALLDTLGAEHAALGRRLRNYPAHPSFVRAHERSANWRETKRAGSFSTGNSAGNMGGRPNGVFEYCGPTATEVRAMRAVLKRAQRDRAARELEFAEAHDPSEEPMQTNHQVAEDTRPQSRVERLAERLRSLPGRETRLGAQGDTSADPSTGPSQPGQSADHDTSSSTTSAPRFSGQRRPSLPTADVSRLPSSLNSRTAAWLGQGESRQRVSPAPAKQIERVELEKLVELVPESDTKRRRLLGNYDKLAQAALDTLRTYVNKHGESSSYPQPDFTAAIKAMERAQSLLGLGELVEDKQPGAVARILAAVPSGAKSG